MDLKKLRETDSPLVGRKSITFRAGFTGESTPSGDEMKKAAAENLKVKQELVEVDKIMQDFGSASATVEIYVYKDTESMRKFGAAPAQKKEKAPKEEKKGQ